MSAQVKHLSIRNVTPQLSEALDNERIKLGMSLNSTVLYLLTESLGLSESLKPKSNGLGQLAGGWTDEEFEEFNDSTSLTKSIDDDMWR